MMNLKGKIVFITGGSKGIGLQTVKQFSNCGAKVIATYNKTKKENMKNVEFVKLDISNIEECKNVVEYVIKKYKKIDILVNNAGIINDDKTEFMSEEQFDSVINVNTKGTFNITKCIIPYMKNEKKGNIINISSISGIYGNIGQANYAASKAAIIGMSHTWAKELGKYNIRVNTIAPGYTETEMLDEISENIIKKIKDKIILKRFANTEEIANVVIFLAGDSSSYITNSVVNVDGGYIG